jgi:predicted DNA-binding transcriptional regulator YafY
MLNSLQRILKIFQRLKNGEKITIDQMAENYDKHRETIKRDIGFIRDALNDEGIELIYNHLNKSYELQRLQCQITPAHIYVILAVLHGSRTLNKDEMKQMEEKLSDLLNKDAQLQLNKLLHSYRYHYRASTNDDMLLLIETLLDSILQQTVLKIVYINANLEVKTMNIAPYTIVFDEGYLYVVTKMADKPEEPFYNLRIDRIQSCEWTKEKFFVKQDGTDFFRAGEYANVSVKMFSGDKPTTIRIRVQAKVISYFEDKFPTFRLIEQHADWSIYDFTVLNEEGALFWILSQRERVEVLAPSETRTRLQEIIREMSKLYE